MSGEQECTELLPGVPMTSVCQRCADAGIEELGAGVSGG
jgi:hypothetical protein